jgi:DNA-dependent RNA polymerase
MELVEKDAKLNDLLSSVIYKRLNHIIHSNLESRDKQLKIEREIYNYNKSAFDELIKSPNIFYDKMGLKLLLDSIKLLERDLEDLKKDLRLLKNKNYKDLIVSIENSEIISVVLSNVIPFIFKNSDSPINTKIVSLYKSVGRKLVYCFIDSMFDKYKKYYNEGGKLFTMLLNINIPMELELENSMTRSQVIEKIYKALGFEEEFYIKFGMDMVLFIGNKSGLYILNNQFIEYNKSYTEIIPSQILDERIIEYLSHDENTYPMVSKPEDWEVNINSGEYIIEKYGGFYLKEFKRESFIHNNPKNSGKTKLINYDIINTINYIQSISYTINKEVLKFLFECLAEGELKDYICLDMHPNTKDYFNLKVKNEKKGLITKILKHNSKYYLDRTILTNAILYRNSDIFFPVFMDFRGRLYTNTPSFSFQGNELIKSLLLFSQGEILNESGVRSLKLYIANCYGISKESNERKLEWVESNINELIDIKNKFWMKGKDALLLLSACIELKNYINNPLKFKSRLPIYIDACCNGLQHLSSMINDVGLAKKVNIYKSNNSDIPEDIYSSMISFVEKKIEKSVENPNLSNLGKIKINRNLIKRGIMTISYGVTKEGIKNQLISDFFTITDYKISNKRQFLLDKNFIKPEIEYDVYFNIESIKELANIIHSILYEQHSKLKIFVTYLKDINKFLYKLNLNIGVV